MEKKIVIIQIFGTFGTCRCKRSMNAVYIFAFTMSVAELEPSMYSDAQKALTLWLNQMCTDWVFQLECTWPDGGDPNPHYQGYFNLKTKSRSGTLKNQIKSILPAIHFSPASNTGKQALKSYSMKEDTRMDGPWGKRAIYMGKDIWPEHKWPTWQRDLKSHLLNSDPDERVIQWIYDGRGGHGKSKFIKWFEWKQHGMGFDYESAQNLKYLVCEAPPQRVYLFDCTKSRPKGVAEEELYSALEAIKNGRIRHGKYKGGQQIMDTPHVVVFANYRPNQGRMTAGRFRVLDITHADEEEESEPLTEEESEPLTPRELKELYEWANK